MTRSTGLLTTLIALSSCASDLSPDAGGRSARVEILGAAPTMGVLMTLPAVMQAQGERVVGPPPSRAHATP